MKQVGRAFVRRNMSATRAATPARGTRDAQDTKAVADGAVAGGGAAACEETWSAGQRHGGRDSEGTQSSRSVDERDGVRVVGRTRAPIGWP
jgi:hypothetical protein